MENSCFDLLVLEAGILWTSESLYPGDGSLCAGNQERYPLNERLL